tara:strand:- start:26329 stop:26667 length:339 start_codon:yes stop_codon:yes gene_type:complete
MQPETLLETLRIVANEPNQRTLAQRLGFSVGKTNYILKALVDKGFVKVERFAQSENKFNYRYVLTPHGINKRIILTECFIERKRKEYQQLSQELEVMKASESNEATFTECLL